MRMPTRYLRAAAVALLATFTLRLDASAQTLAAAPTLGIDNFARVNDTYFRGAQPAGSDYADLAALGVKTIINLTGDEDVEVDERAAVEQQRHALRAHPDEHAPRADRPGTRHIPGSGE